MLVEKVGLMLTAKDSRALTYNLQITIQTIQKIKKRENYSKLIHSVSSQVAKIIIVILRSKKFLEYLKL